MPRNLKTVHQWLLVVLMLFPILQLNLISLIIGLLFILSIINYVRNPDRSFHKQAFFVTLPVLLVVIIFTLFSNDMKQAGGMIERRLSLLCIPFIFSSVFLNDDKKHFHRLITVYCYAALALLLWGNAVILFNGTGHWGNDFSYFYRYSFEIATHVHPTYVSLVVFSAALFLIHKLLFRINEYANRNTIIIESVVAGALLIGGILQASRMPTIAFLIAFLFLFVMAWRTTAHKKYFKWMAGAMVILLLASSPFLFERLGEIKGANLEGPTNESLNSTNMRAGIWQCNLKLLKEHWVSGMGTGNVQKALNDCYTAYQTGIYKEMDYNSHSEYMNMWLMAGLVGILALLYMLGRSFVIATKAGDYRYIAFLIFICLCLSTENLLERQTGVLVFSIWQSIFANRLS